MPSPFDPAPSLPGWNYDFEAGAPWPAGDDAWFRAIFDFRLYNNYAEAAAEKDIAIGGDGTAFPALASGDYSLNAWAALQLAVVNDLAYAYLKAYNLDGSQMDYATPFDLADLALPDPATWLRRKFPREITSLADAGTDGWFARLIGGGVGSGRIFERVGGAWVVAADGSRPDVLSDYGTYLSGDYFGPWFLNDLRDLLNSLAVVGLVSGSIVIGQYTANGESNNNFGTDDADYLSLANLSSFDIGPQAYDFKGAGSGLSPNVRRAYGYGVVTGIPTNGAMNRVIYFTALGHRPFSGALGVIGFDGQGDAFAQTEDLYNLLDTSAPIATADYQTPQLGSLTLPPNLGGYEFDNETILMRWDVTGGFSRTKYT